MTTPTHRPLPAFLLLAAALAAGGCSLLSRKPAEPKENPSLAGQTEDVLRRRWIERRSAELAAQGVAADAARTQAAAEFPAKFPYTGGART